jgi:hypothetical protein
MGKSFILSLILLVSTTIQQENFLEAKLNEREANRIADKFKPILVFHEKETFFPIAIEQLNIDWSRADLGNSSSFVSYNITGSNRLNNSAPIYASVLQNTTDNSLRITYAFLYAFNDCGPYFKVNIDTIFGFSMKPEFSICPMGKHFGDLEHISIFLSKIGERYEIKYLVYGNHDSEQPLLASEVEIKEGRPVVYVAKGSHASYPKQGKFEVLKGWNIPGKTFSTSGIVEESTVGNIIKWSRPTVRLLKFNGDVVSNISREEAYLSFVYQGRLGAPIDNQAFNYFETEISAYAKEIEKISAQAYKIAMNSIYFLRKEVLKTACYTLAHPSRTWW